jgi:hypothetical protein
VVAAKSVTRTCKSESRCAIAYGYSSSVFLCSRIVMAAVRRRPSGLPVPGSVLHTNAQLPPLSKCNAKRCRSLNSRRYIYDQTNTESPRTRRHIPLRILRFQKAPRSRRAPSIFTSAHLLIKSLNVATATSSVSAPTSTLKRSSPTPRKTSCPSAPSPPASPTVWTAHAAP